MAILRRKHECTTSNENHTKMSEAKFNDPDTGITPCIFAVDFDGTCVTHEFPKVGKDIGAVRVLKRMVDSGHKIILFTMRSDVVNPRGEENELHLESGDYLTAAVDWFKENNIPLFGIQSNPTQHTWTTSPKAYAHYYIDDAAIGCPLKFPHGERPFVDWDEIERWLETMGLLKPIS